MRGSQNHNPLKSNLQKAKSLRTPLSMPQKLTNFDTSLPSGSDPEGTRRPDRSETRAVVSAQDTTAKPKTAKKRVKFAFLRHPPEMINDLAAKANLARGVVW